MKKLLLICAAVMAFAVPAHAQLFMAWNACDGTSGSTTANSNLDCDLSQGGVASELFGTFGLPGSTAGVVAIDGIIDLAFQGQNDVPAFWHFETGGCNASGLGYSFARASTATCATTNSVLFCAANGSGCGGGVTAYINGSQVPLGGLNRARLLFTNARPSTSPVTLPGMPTRIYCFHISISTTDDVGNPIACAGCTVPTAICWNQAVIFNNAAQAGGEGLAALIDSATPGSTGTVASNGATISVATNKKSWGQLKSLYR